LLLIHYPNLSASRRLTSPRSSFISW
jgi:hypothetical protein